MNPWLPLATWFLQALSDWMRLKPSMDTTALLNRMINSSCCTQNTLVNAWHSYVSFITCTVCTYMQPNEGLVHVCTHQQGWGGGWVCVFPPSPFFIIHSVPQSYEMCYIYNTCKQHNWLYLTTKSPEDSSDSESINFTHIITSVMNCQCHDLK